MSCPVELLPGQGHHGGGRSPHTVIRPGGNHPHDFRSAENGGDGVSNPGAGEMVLIPKGEVHGTYNPYSEPLVFLAILSPSGAPGAGRRGSGRETPWLGLRGNHLPTPV